MKAIQAIALFLSIGLVTAQSCYHDWNCESGFCDPKTNKCSDDLSSTIPCLNDDMCPPNTLCDARYKQCLPFFRGPRRMASQPCYASMDCPTGYRCLGDQCRPYLNPTMRCRSDFECESGICDYDSGCCA